MGDVNQTDADGNTPLHVLMSVFDMGGKRAGAIGQILLRHNADCNMMNSDKWAPLHLAARRGQLRGISFVLNHIDVVDASCLKGSCSHQPSHNKALSSCLRTCTRAFDLNLRGGSHLWTPLHLAGHACHVSVVQVLIESGADVLLRNVDGRTARHVSRGNMAISKLLRKAEDEWLWHRTHQIENAESKDSNEASNDRHRRASCLGRLEDFPGKDELGYDNLSTQDKRTSAVSGGTDEGIVEALKDEDGYVDDAIEGLAKDIEGTVSGGTSLVDNDGNNLDGAKSFETKRRLSEPAGSPEGSARPRRDRIVEKCCETHYSKVELQQLQAANFSVAPAGGVEEFMAMFTKLTQPGPRHRLPFLLSKGWVKEMVPKLLDDERCHTRLLHSSLITNEDYIRMLSFDTPREHLCRFGDLRNKEQETMLHVLCKGSSTRAFPSSASRADLLSFLLTICPPETFDLEARDLRGQTPLHLAAQSGDIGLVQVLLEYGSDPNAQEETTGWTPLHFAVAKAHYALILQLLQHDQANVNQVDKFDWPPLLEACSRLDARSTSLLTNGGAHLGFRNQHQFDVLKAVDTSKKDLAAKRWMSCLVVSNGFRFEESTVQLNTEDRETLERERAYYDTRA